MAHDTALREVASLDSVFLEEGAITHSESIPTMLIGRDEEITALSTLLRDCRPGNGVVAVIRGPIASGKTTLLQAFASQAAATGAIFLGAAATRAERGLPLGILDQLLRSGPVPAVMSHRVADLIKDCARTGSPAEPEPETVSPLMARAFDDLLNVLERLSEGHPVVIAVDDMHYADVASLRCLSYLARRASASRILTVLTECPQVLPVDRLLHAEILRQGNCRCIPLASLSLSGVADLLSEHLDLRAAHLMASSCHAMTGGNPLLVEALAQDAQVFGDEPAKLVPARAFRSAVVTCLHRHDPGIVELAQAVAVLGADTTPSLLAELLDISAESAAHGIDALRASKLLESGAFRHEAARQAVLEHMTSDERAALHGRAAQALYRTGAEPAILAGHLVDAHRVDGEWTISVLQEAAERAIADGDASRAIEYLRRAQDRCFDDRQRAAIRFALACAEWTINPESAARYLPELVADAYAGRLDGAAIGSLAYCLLWVGDTSSAAEMLEMLDMVSEETAAGKAEHQEDHRRSPLNFIYPDLAKHARDAVPDEDLSLKGSAGLRARDAGAQPAADSESGAAVFVAERILRGRGLNDPTLASVTTALMALISEDMLDSSAFWCNALMEESGAAPGGVLRTAVLTSFCAIIETRRGNLQAADKYARTAFSLLSRRAWGVAIGAPLSSLLLTSIASGRPGDAVAWLRVPVPEAMFGTPYGLLYLYARGEYYLATACPQAALADFTDCGNRMLMWGLDQPGLVPWRAKAAEAYLAMGDNLKARDLCKQQLAQVGSRSSRTRGILLRAIALTHHPSKRTALLRESAEVLRDSGARLELAYTFSELSNAHLALGEDSRAHWAAHQARNLAERCGAQTLKATLGKTDRESPEVGNSAGPGLLARLSDAERRVATLAACGYTNLQIAHKLYITVSTVEQHLTRVYRKLAVAGRAELPVDI